jgi:hypothetical protein
MSRTTVGSERNIAVLVSALVGHDKPMGAEAEMI